ncbi:hypothetical protein FXB41_39840 [Bradyrhizobium canariense]|uniref:hypothetical protein n=1 Tax=Bradyrhizobium TaxID=374 RepID=UPI001CA53820|nr:hypothetical protein [Bradyrhizobium canariense]MBW5440699.1 hypothetical protein [Bradyrhizobium canariense]
MASTLGDKLAEEQITKSLDEHFSSLASLAREKGVGPLARPTRMKTSRAPPGTGHRLAGWRYLAFIGSLFVASITVVGWRWSSSVDSTMMVAAVPPPPVQTAPNDVAPTAVSVSSEIAQQLQPMARDLAALRQTVEQLEMRQEQLVRGNENLASQLKASQEEMARNHSTIDQIKATQIQMARESQTLTEQLNASQEQLAHVIANASAPKAMPEVSSGEPKVMPEIPLPRPRQSANVAQTQKPAPPQAKKPQPSLAWPWSVH